MDQRKRAATTSDSAIVDKASALAVTICARRVANYRYVHGNGCALRDQVVSEGELAVQLGFSPHLVHPVMETAKTAAAPGLPADADVSSAQGEILIAAASSLNRGFL